MRAWAIDITATDRRYFKIEPGYRYGHYLECDQPPPRNTRIWLCVYRIPEGMTAPLGRIPPELLEAMAVEAAKPVATPQVLARYPFWSYIVENGIPIEVPDDTVFEEQARLPDSLLDGRTGQYVQPLNAMVPIDQPPTAKPEKPAKEVPVGQT